MINTIIYRPYIYLFRLIRSNRHLHRLLFGYLPIKEGKGQSWDWCTLVIKKALKLYLKPEMKILDVGTGSVAVLAMFASLKLHVKNILAIDYIPELISNSKKNSEFYKRNITFKVSDLFQNVSGKFDLITFNSPYINKAQRKKMGLSIDGKYEKTWCGGDRGYETIERFLLTSPNYINNNGIVILGVNHFYLKKELVKNLLKRTKFDIDKDINNYFTHTTAYILKLNKQNKL